MEDLRNITRIFTAPLDFINKYFKALLFFVYRAICDCYWR